MFRTVPLPSSGVFTVHTAVVYVIRFCWQLSNRIRKKKESPGTPVPGVTRNSGFPEIRVTPVTQSSGWLRKPGLTGDSGNTKVWVIPGTRRSGWVQQPGVPGDSGNPEFRVTPGTRGSWWLGEPVIPDVSGKPELRVPGFTRNCGFPKSPGIPGSRSHQELRVPGITRNHPEFRVTGVTHNSGFPETPGTPCSQGDSWILLTLLASCQQTCMTYTVAVCTVINSRWWTEELSETRRVLFQNKFEKLVHLVGFIIRILKLNLWNI